MEEIIEYYIRQGAPSDQNALVNMLRELGEQCGGAVTQPVLSRVAEACKVKESFLLAVIKRYPSLKVDNRHVLEICGGPNCGKCRENMAFAEKMSPNDRLQVKLSPCMRMCGKGPNIKLDGKIYHQADVNFIKKLIASYL